MTNGTNGNIVGVDWKTVVANDGTSPTVADNGGTTPTVALLSSGPAVDAGNSPVFADEPTIFWQFEETTSGTASNTAIGGDPSLFLFPSGTTVNQDGAKLATGRALGFDGTNDFSFTQNSIPEADLGGDTYAISLWFNTDDAATNQSLVAVTDPNNADGHAVLIETATDGTLRFLNRLPSGNTGGDNLNAGQYFANNWYHLAAVRNSESIILYVNGVEVGRDAASGSFASTGHDITIGQISAGLATRNFDGEMDDLAIFNYAITADQVAAQFAQGARSAWGNSGDRWQRRHVARHRHWSV